MTIATVTVKLVFLQAMMDMLLKPGLDRIRAVFDYEKLGGSPLLGVQGTVLITHGRAKRRMISYAVAVGAAAARAHVPELIADAFKHERRGAAHQAKPRAGPPTSDDVAAIESLG